MIYHGSTPTGKRIHLGETLIIQYESGKQRVQTRCGTDMFAFKEGQASATQAMDYCKVCYRSVAWEYFMQDMAEAAARNTGVQMYSVR